MIGAEEQSGRESIREARSVVVKIGSAVLTGSGRKIDKRYVGQFAGQIARAHEEGRSITVVSSGAVVAGLDVLGLESKPTDVTMLQASAAAGQSILMSMWRDVLDRQELGVAQLLLTRKDFDSRERFLNIRNCAQALQERGCVAVVNENDTVATDEISLGDNDVLAAQLAACIGAEALILLTSEEGVRDAEDKVIPFAADSSDLHEFASSERSDMGRGGMVTKLEAARIAQLAGMPALIGAGRPAGNLGRILGGSRVGTCISSDGMLSHRGRRRWIALTATPNGIIEVDEGASEALSDRNASLLAKGVVGCQGRFQVGDVVAVRDTRGRDVGRGLTNLSADEVHAVMGHDSRELPAILGRQAHEEVIHRDNLAITMGRENK